MQRSDEYNSRLPRWQKEHPTAIARNLGGTFHGSAHMHIPLMDANKEQLSSICVEGRAATDLRKDAQRQAITRHSSQTSHNIEYEVKATTAYCASGTLDDQQGRGDRSRSMEEAPRRQCSKQLRNRRKQIYEAHRR